MTSPRFLELQPFSEFDVSVKREFQAKLRLAKDICKRLSKISTELPSLDQVEECSLDISVFLLSGLERGKGRTHWVTQSNLLAELKFLPEFDLNTETPIQAMPSESSFPVYRQHIGIIALKIATHIEEIELASSSAKVILSLIGIDIMICDAVALITRLRLYEALLACK